MGATALVFVLASAFCAQDAPLRPRGSYSAVVRTALFAGTAQKITIRVQSEGSAHIALRGLVDHDSEFAYGYEQEGRRWWSSFSAPLEDVLKKWRCTLESFSYDARADAAVVHIRVPLLGRKKITLTKDELSAPS